MSSFFFAPIYNGLLLYIDDLGPIYIVMTWLMTWQREGARDTYRVRVRRGNQRISMDDPLDKYLYI